MIKTSWKICLLALLLLQVACQSDQDPAPAEPSPTTIAGQWRGVLTSPGGELPFVFEIHATDDGYRGVIENGDEQTPFSDVRVDANRVVLAFSWFDSEITAELSEDRSVMRGQWRQTRANEDTRMPFEATRGIPVRFLPLTGTDASLEPARVSGNWEVTFTDEDGSEPAVGLFDQEGSTLRGTFMTPTGDYRFLAGDVTGRTLRLSTFDGAHAFLFQASVDDAGRLSGDFWSRETYHATWTGESTRDVSDILPDAWDMVRITTEDQRIGFTFDDLEGNPVSLDDERFAGKPVLVNLFGSWCPNCNDEAPVLADLYRRYHPEGLEIIGLAFEYTGDVARDRVQVAEFRDRHGIDYPLLLAGTTDKSDAAAALGFLDKVVAYPTSIFLDANHDVTGIHSGFAGPGTGVYFDQLVSQLHEQVELILASQSD